ncbi:cell growth regulator with EF hand domain protein 1 isoform X2 [Eublepharis macularius]|uniref:Cell growth regulator with EF hand domain protein 1 isoform X2 n=1 Tax=Eublepharis macularius TaxID=481883 RepID=A0AA97JR32_EUBMA|nr:cell growth regulator with EF hand domain protein 1 isoform X2 [Eublepharis macularius]
MPDKQISIATPLNGASMEILLATLLLLLPVSWAAPQDGSKRPETPSDSKDHPILNPLHPGKENVRMLQDYLKMVGQVERDADAMTREQALLLLFALHDYDKSGRLDGLEFMRLLSELAAKQAKRQPLPDLVVLMVDSILETQDLNRDGWLEPSELFLGSWQDQSPVLLAAPSGGDEAVLWASPESDGQSIGLLDLPDQQGTAEPPAAPGTFQGQGVMEAPSLSTAAEMHKGDPGQEAPLDTQGQEAEMPPASGN